MSLKLKTQNRLYFLIFIVSIITTSCKKDDKKELESPKANILLIISDDQAWDDYSFMGHPDIQTPSIDKLAREGLTYRYGYVTAPLCRPSLASIATGLYPHQHGITGNDPAFELDGMQRWSEEWNLKRAELNKKLVERIDTFHTITTILKDHGYVSFQSGKWWEGSWTNGKFTDGMTHGDSANGGRHGDEGLKIGRESLQPIFDFIDLARQEQKPFFVWYAPFMPHTPHTPPDSLFQKYLPNTDNELVAKYMAMVEWFDITIGQLLEFLAQKDLEENTLVIYVCDNGWITNTDKNRNQQYAPRSKQSPYERGIRTPIIFKWPGEIEPHMDTTHFVSSIDILPTILRILSIDSPVSVPGLNILDREAIQSRSVIFSEDFSHDMIDLDTPSKSLEHLVVLKEPWKLIVPYNEMINNQSPELYNILEDPYEIYNVAEVNPQIVMELSKDLKDFWIPQ